MLCLQKKLSLGDTPNSVNCGLTQQAEINATQKKNHLFRAQPLAVFFNVFFERKRIRTKKGDIMITKNDAIQQSTGKRYLKIALLVIGIVLISSNLRPAITSVSPLIGEIITDTGLSSTLAGLLTALPILFFAVFSLLASKLARRHGMEFTILVCLVILTIGIILRSLPSMAALFIGTAVLGVAVAVANVLLPSLVKHEFPNRIGLMTGLYSMSMTLWAGLASGLSVPLSQGLGLGWKGALMCWAIFSVITIIFWLPNSRRKPSQLSEVRNGYLWRSGLAWQVTLFFSLQSICFYSTVAWLPELLHDRGVSVALAGWSLALIQIVGVPTTFLVPLIAGRLSNQKGLVIATLTLMIIGLTGLLFSGNSWLMLWILLIGLGQGAAFSLALTFIGLRSHNAQQASELSGMTQSVGYLLSSFAPIIFGFLHDLTHTWTFSLLFIIVATFIQLLIGMGAGRNAFVSSESVSFEKLPTEQPL